MRQRSKLHWSNVVCHPWAIVVYNVEPTLGQRRNAIWEPTHDPQSSTNQCPASPKVDIPIQSLLDTPTRVLPTTIPVVSPTPPVILTAIAESTPTIVSPPPIIKTATTITSVSPSRVKPTTSHPCKLYIQGHYQYGRRGQMCPNPHPLMCFRFLRNGARGCINLITLMPTLKFAELL